MSPGSSFESTELGVRGADGVYAVSRRGPGSTESKSSLLRESPDETTASRRCRRPVLLRRGLGRVSRQADHDRRARSPPAGRPTRSRATSPKRCASRSATRASSSRTSAGPAARSARRRWRGAEPTATRCCCITSAWHVAGALSQDDVRHARRLRVPRHDQRRADDDRSASRACRPTTTPSWRSGSRPTRARSISRMPASAPRRISAACCSRAPSRSTCRPFRTRARRRR